MELLSIQSSVAFGHVGNSAAVFPLQRLGTRRGRSTPCTSPTTPGTASGAVRCSPPPTCASDPGVEERACSSACAAVLSRLPGRRGGGRGDPRHGRPGQGAQPVGGLLLRPGDGRRRAAACSCARASPSSCATRSCRAADVITPNHFELDFLSGRTTTPLADVLDAVDAVRDRGRATCWSPVLLADETPDTLDVVAVSDDGAWAVTPLLPISPNGCGDVTAALFLAHLLAHRLARRRAGAHDLVGLRHPGGDARGRHPRDPAGRRPGRDRRPRRAVRGASNPVIRTTSGREAASHAVSAPQVGAPLE